MSKGDNSPGISRLAGVMQSMVEKGQDGNPILEFGTIQSDGSLLTDSFPLPIAKADYQVCRHLKARSVSTSGASVGEYGSHSHSVETRQALRKGDRVLVAWVQDDPVVIDIILSAGEVL